MTTQPSTPAPTPAPRKSIDVRQIVSGLETVAFIVAVVLQALGFHSDAIITALAGASAHAINHT